MKPYLITLFVLTILNASISKAQLTDDFSEPYFATNPNWAGDTSQFSLQTQALKLASSGSDSSYLSTLKPNIITGIAEWNFDIALNFSPSSSNYARFYLSSSNVNTEDTLKGYFLQFGESGSNDAIVLCKQDGWQITTIARGPDTQIATAFNIKIKVTRNINGFWIIKTGQNNAFSFCCSGTENTFTNGGYLGFRCNYTSSNATNFTFDNLYYGKEIVDTIAPQIVNSSILSANILQIAFSEKLDIASAISFNNYQFNQGRLLDSIRLDPTSDQATLFFHPLLLTGDTISLLIQNIQDTVGNILAPKIISLTYIKLEKPNPGDLVFNEIMADPSGANNLPNIEFLEIYNRTNKYIAFYKCRLSDASTQVILSNDTIKPFGYVTICFSGNVILLQNYGIENIIGLSGFPSLNNDGDILTLKDSMNTIIDQVNYSLAFYHDEIKKEGGWSIERIDPNFTCQSEGNWQASKDARGGSPSLSNSVIGNFTDVTSPYLDYVSIIDSITLIAHFSKDLDTNSLTSLTNFLINNSVNYSKEIHYTEANRKDITVILSTSLEKGIIYELKVNSLVKDCAGNLIDGFNTSQFSIADSLKSDDLIINEILFNPRTDEYDFVELYNRGNSTIDIQQLRISSADIETQELKDNLKIINLNRSLLPNDYIVLTENKESILRNYKVKDHRKIIECALPTFSDGEGIVVITDPSINVLDSFHYNEDMHFELLNFTEGISLERINPFISTIAGNWHSASANVNYATPTIENSQYSIAALSENMLHLSPELFSPDNDGYNDILHINFRPKSTDYYGSITIYNAQGLIIKYIAANELAGSFNEWIWDGTNKNNELVPPGIYVLYSRWINLNGDVKEEKLPIALAYKF
jgi:hypothetical protein